MAMVDGHIEFFGDGRILWLPLRQYAPLSRHRAAIPVQICNGARPIACPREV